MPCKCGDACKNPCCKCGDNCQCEPGKVCSAACQDKSCCKDGKCERGCCGKQ